MYQSSLPPPHPEALALSQSLSTQIIDNIHQAGGQIPFVDFMKQALYTPKLGYYSSGLRKFGKSGDFTTAPEISPFFAQCLANQCQQVLADFDDPVILEFGAGSGIMAADILTALENLHCLPTQYWILEVSAALRDRQQETLKKHVPHLLERVQWLDQLPQQAIQGVILANEVLDAMPIHRFCVEEQGISELYVGYQDSKFVWQQQVTEHQAFKEAVTQLQLPVGYISEMNLALSAWIQTISDILAKGLILLIDYGFPSHEYYHPERSQGTLMCHYRHHAHSDPLTLVGLQDITAHVDFTAVAHAAHAAGLHVSGYTRQAQFLLATGLPDLLSKLDFHDTQNYLQQTQHAKTLILPNEMGDLFKVIALTRDIDTPLSGFVRDDRCRL
ncbi:MAG: SAM-dependent methyltransferase [Thiomargarita sp.]|nr:SAM-dependent methyltransferase [Thiomargarita sp.]